jgi:hypothetical protein
MKKLGYVFAALGVIAVAAPSIASAETIVVKHGHHHWGPRAEMRVHREHRWGHDGWRHRHADKIVIMKHRHHRDHD